MLSAEVIHWVSTLTDEVLGPTHELLPRTIFPRSSLGHPTAADWGCGSTPQVASRVKTPKSLKKTMGG